MNCHYGRNIRFVVMLQEFSSLIAAAMLAAFAASAAGAAPATLPASDPAPITRQEYERLLLEQRQMRTELDQLKKERQSPPPAPSSADPVKTPASQEDLDDVQKQVSAVREDVERYRPGAEGFFISGDAAVGFVAQRKNNSSFNASFAPLFLWQPAPRLLFEAAFDVGIDTSPDATSETTFDLTIANASYLVNDWLAVGGGLFVTPFGVYHNHFDPPWINKFPDDPLAFGDGGIAPGSSVGIFAKGAFPIATTKFTYDVYLTNGPNLITGDPVAAGSLNFDDFTDLNNNKAVGGRLGFLPMGNIEMGYSVMAAQSAPRHFNPVHVLLQAVDLNWRQEVAALSGTLDFRAEWVWSSVQHATYDPTGSLGFGPLTFSNYRDGGYVQLCYRPTQIHNAVIRNLEFVNRWDYLRIPVSAPGGDTEQRYAVGLDYWLNPQAVFKVAYEFDWKKIGPSENALLVQFGLGL